MSDSEPDLPSTPPSRSRTEPLECPPAPRKLRPTKTWEGSRDCRAVRRLDFTAGRPSLQVDYAGTPALSTADSQASASLPQWASAPLAEVPAPSGGLLAARSGSLPDEVAQSILGPSTPYATAPHGTQQHEAWPDLLHRQPLQPFSYDRLSQPRGIRPLQLHQSHQGPPYGFPLQSGPRGAANADRLTALPQQQSQPFSPQPAWPPVSVPEWQTGARILPEQQPAAGSGGLCSHGRPPQAQGLSALNPAVPLAPAQASQGNSPFAFAASCPAPSGRTEDPSRPSRAETGPDASPFSIDQAMHPVWSNTAMPTPFAFSSGQSGMPFGFPTPSNQPGVPGSPALGHHPNESFRPVGGLSHASEVHRPSGSSERQLFGMERLVSRGSGTGAFLP